MEKNFTTLNIETLNQSFDDKKVNKSSNTILLIIATFTAVVLVVMLLILIQKKTNPTNSSTDMQENNTVISPTITIPSPTVTSVILKPTRQPDSSPSGTIVPTRETITINPTLAPPFQNNTEP